MRINRYASLLVAGLAGIITSLNAQTNAAPGDLPACCQESSAERPFTDRSVYQLPSDWNTDGGETLKLGRLRGKPQVVAMIFTSCAGACPILVHQMQELAGSLPENIRTNVGFLLVSFDSVHDTPAVLHDYRAARGLPEKQWTLLHGRPEDVQELALVLGVKYRQSAGGQFSHSNQITLLNAEGEVSFQQSGLDSSPEEMASKLTRLLKSE